MKKALKIFSALLLLSCSLIVSNAIIADNKESHTNNSAGPNNSSQNNMSTQQNDQQNGSDFTDPAKTIVVSKKSPTITIKLKANPTTGFSWFLAHYDDKLLIPISAKYYPPSDNKLIGAPGFTVWKFRVRNNAFNVPQMTNIALQYMRPWTLEGAMRVFITVITENPE